MEDFFKDSNFLKKKGILRNLHRKPKGARGFLKPRTPGEPFPRDQQTEKQKIRFFNPKNRSQPFHQLKKKKKERIIPNVPFNDARHPFF